MIIGTTGSGAGQQNAAYIAGINGVTITPTNMVVTTSTDQLGTVAYVPSTAWTPVLNFGGSSTGITTSYIAGSYSRLGGVVTFVAAFVLSSKGAQTGAATITGLPVAAAIGTPIILMCNLLNIGANYVPVAQINGTTTTIGLYAESVTGGGQANITNAMFVDTTTIQISGSYIV